MIYQLELEYFRPFEGQKNPKNAEGHQKKTKCLRAEAENTPKQVDKS